MVIVHISASPGVKTPKALQQAKECTIEALKTIIDYTDTHHVEILLENLVPLPTYIRLGAEIEDIIDIANALDTKRVGICIDTGHSLLTKHDPCSDIQKAGSLLKSLHINDNDGLQDLHMIPGNGVIKWNQICQTLRDIHYQGSFLLEVAGRNPLEQTVRSAIDYSRNLLQLNSI
jgi:sugar phosphate isomerase/epimerase